MDLISHRWKGQPELIALRRKIPPLQQILIVYATITFLVYGWASVAFFWKVPSWLYFLSLGEIAAILAYALASSFVESIMLLFFLLVAGLVLPSRWLSDKFAANGTIIIYSLTFWVLLFNMSSLIQLPTSGDVLLFAVGSPLTAGLAIVLSTRSSRVPSLLTALGNRLTIFLYVWLPAGLAGICVVILRLFA
ncbi:MAG TPA: hypothetical protein VI524_09040 [Anaerolineales bacterium]|nr:hypothetical protein [Anaerolineales bacterium]